MSPLRLSAADLGTNTLKITHAEIGDGGEIRELSDIADTIRIGKGIEETGMIEPERLERCVLSLQEQEAFGRQLGSMVFIGVATEAIRVAANGQHLLDRIAAETSWQVRLISGDEEAHLTFLGLREHVRPRGTTMIVDVGGGSTELILSQDGEVVSSRSVDLGSGRLADRFFAADPPGDAALDAAVAAAIERLQREDDLPAKVDAMIVSGGNGVFLDELASQLYPDSPLDRATIERLLRHFASTAADDTAGRLGIVHERARVLPAGGAVAMACLVTMQADSVSAVPSGIRPGLIRQYLSGQ